MPDEKNVSKGRGHLDVEIAQALGRLEREGAPARSFSLIEDKALVIGDYLWERGWRHDPEATGG